MLFLVRFNLQEVERRGSLSTGDQFVQSPGQPYNGLMAEALSNPHDRFFKEVFSRQETAQDFLLHYLPPEVTGLLDLASLEISKDSFIDPDLQEHFSDLLYKVALPGGREAYIYLLFEHKSYPDRLVAWQLLRYMVRIWEQALKQQQPLLPIVPLVVYHGPTKWPVARHFTALFELPEALKPYVPAYEYWLCDLSQYSDEAIRGEVTLRAALLLLKYMMREDLGERLGTILGLLRELAGRRTGLEYLETILRYVSRGTDKLSPQALEQVISEVFAEGEELMPTIAEQWLEQGRAEGREEGREAALGVLRRFLAHRFGVAINRFDAELSVFDLAAITYLSDIAFEVENLAEFEVKLADLKAQAQPDSLDPLSLE